MSARALGLAFLLLAPAWALAADPDPWFGEDKALHFAATAGLAGLGYGGAALFTESRPLRLGAGAALSLSAGVAKELWDLAGHGTPSWRDFTWDVIGCAAGLLVSWLVDVFVITPSMTGKAVCPGCPVSLWGRPGTARA